MRGIFHFGRVISHGLSALGIAGKLGLGAGALVVGTSAPAMACGPDSYVGAVCAYAFAWCPDGWLPADGRQVTISGNQALYSLIGTQYGGSQQSGQFNLPDLRGRAILHYGAGPGLPVQPFASQSGVPLSTVGIVNLPPHNHSAIFTGTGGGTQTVNVPASPGTLGVTATLSAKDEIGAVALNPDSYIGKGPATGTGSAQIYVSGTSTAPNVNLKGIDVQLTGTAGNGPISFTYQSGVTGGTVATGNTGNGVAFSNQSPSLAMSYCIMVNGLYPPRP
ncbi:MAG TPA: tail fiber protein [Rhizobium sp.]|nr:tail fiber protein [Rhizobium sp.]